MKEHLFIGGPWDGKRESVELHNIIVMEEWNGAQSKRHTYIGHRFYSDGFEPHLVYFHSSIEDKDRMAILLNGYHAY